MQRDATLKRCITATLKHGGRAMTAFRNNKKRKNGQALAEFALLVPVLLLLVIGTIQFGMILYSYISVIQLTREGTRWVAVNASKTDSEITTYITGIAPATLTRSNIAVSVSPSYAGGQIPSGRYTGNTVSVGIRYSLQGKLFIPTNFFGWQVPTTIPAYTVMMRVEKL